MYDDTRRWPGCARSGGSSYVRRACAVLISLAALAAPTRAESCPNCAVGIQARSEIWQQDFTYNLLVALAPLLLIVGVCARIEASGAVAARRASRRSAKAVGSSGAVAHGELGHAG
jgi:hypothetical protein